MVRSAAKNHAFVAIVTDPADYAALIAALDDGGDRRSPLRKRLAAKAFAATAAYDAMIAELVRLRRPGRAASRRRCR